MKKSWIYMRRCRPFTRRFVILRVSLSGLNQCDMNSFSAFFFLRYLSNFSIKVSRESFQHKFLSTWLKFMPSINKQLFCFFFKSFFQFSTLHHQIIAFHVSQWFFYQSDRIVQWKLNFNTLEIFVPQCAFVLYLCCVFSHSTFFPKYEWNSPFTSAVWLINFFNVDFNWVKIEF